MTDELLAISAFARRVGLTPSALRFYDDCGLLRPAKVDDQNGYRYYAPDQEPRAALLRDLREIDLPLAEVRVVLDEGPAAGAAVVRAHLRTVEGKADAARRAAARILASLPAVPYECAVTLGGAELASAIRQVAAAAAPTDEIPALACVLIELDEDEVTLVATDRYRLSVRKLHPVAFTGYPRNLLVTATELTALARWVAAAAEVRIETGPAGTTFAADGAPREVPVVDEEFPAYQSILEGLAPPTSRVVVDRLRLLDLLTGETVALSIDSDRLTVTPKGATAPSGGLEVIASGEPLRIGFTASLLAAALTVSVGPDVLLEIGPVDRPVVVRSADQGTFTTLVMPALLDG
ncbi:MerR-like DNA binding protein [Kribbella orskensis]|uniref:MerR-like DNA binding protein n=1 Tax=Kribbella orskensis TaxID=2512216 RepID=A0ABY2BT81_9ACTN|nr:MULTISPECIES: MerR family transcriptional regulator [Kribbella]TCN37145.1 MerR-like DNA binding protein [Kribbella sp. VKM Ac-2500]TCO27947.1 MerR-like DNA binding protein [Kribbella orskensis]